MKAGILTFHNTLNYGACLQAFALQETVAALGEESCIVDYRPKSLEVHYSIHHLFSRLKRKGLKSAVLFVIADILNLVVNIKEESVFQNWRAAHYRLSDRIYRTPGEIMQETPDLDLCIVGSDQVWNSEITEGLDPVFFLCFGGNEMKRVSYAASIGKDVLSEEEKYRICGYLKSFDQIALREATHLSALKGTLEREVFVTVDPTMLLTADEWKCALDIGEPIVQGNYIFYHSIDEPDELNNTVKLLQKKTELEIVRIGKHSRFENERLIKQANPTEFVNLISNASYVVTDSFHGVAFSINFRKQFFCVLGNGRNSRILNLLGQIGLEKCAKKRFTSEDMDGYKINYSEDIENRLGEVREGGKAYLRRCFESDKEVTPDKEIDLVSDKRFCCGCGMCSVICPTHSITMHEDTEGMRYPSIDTQTCIKCKKCLNTCAFKQELRNKGIVTVPEV